MAKRNLQQDSKDIIEQGIISIKKGLSDFLGNITRDRRTRKSTQKAAAEFFEGKRAKQAGEELGVSYQRAAAIKRGIESGKYYSPELRDIFKEKNEEFNIRPQYVGSEEGEGGVWFFPDRNRLERTHKVEEIKAFPFLEDAIEWWSSVIGSDKFIAITREKGKKPGDDFYHVVGIGERSQRPKTVKSKSGKSRKVTENPGKVRLADIRKKYQGLT